MRIQYITYGQPPCVYVGVSVVSLSWLNLAMGYIRSSLASKWSLPVTFSHFALSAGQNMWVRTSSLTPASLGIPVHPQALNMTASARLAKVSTGRVYFYACTRIGDCQHSVS